MAKLHHIRQLAVKTEGTAGTAETGLGAGDLLRVRELTLEQNPQYFDRPLHTRSFGYTPRRQENTSCTLTFAVELAGHADNSGSWDSTSTVPQWSRLLTACGMAVRPIYGYTVDGSITGTIQSFESVTGGTSSESFTVYGDYRGSESPVYGGVSSGALTAGETLTGSTSGASYTLASPFTASHDGFVWYPNTDSTTTCTIELYNDGDKIVVYGCRGDVTLDCQSQDIALLRFTVQGIYSATSTASLVDDSVAAAYPELTPPTFVDASLALFDGSTTVTPNFTELQLTLGNNVVMRQNSNSASGWLAAHIANRTPNGRFNPDDPGVSSYNYREKFQDNTRWALKAEWGSTVGNTFRAVSPAIELDSVGDGERDEVQSLDLSFRMTRGFEYGANETNVGDDNDFLLFNL